METTEVYFYDLFNPKQKCCRKYHVDPGVVNIHVNADIYNHDTSIRRKLGYTYFIQFFENNVVLRCGGGGWGWKLREYI